MTIPIAHGKCDLLQCRILAVGDDAAQQLPPAREQHGAVVKLDGEQIAFVEALLCEERVANLLCTRA